MTAHSYASRCLSIALVLCTCVSPWAWAQHRRDPLNPLEIDALRETALEPEKRIKLYVKFARERLQAMEQLRTDPKTTNRAQQTRDKLQDFLDVYDEMNDNIDNFADRKEDLRKALKAVVEADTEFQAKLRALKSSANTNKEEVEQYRVLLADAMDTVDHSINDHRQLLTEQVNYPPKKKADVPPK